MTLIQPKIQFLIRAISVISVWRKNDGAKCSRKVELAETLYMCAARPVVLTTVLSLVVGCSSPTQELGEREATLREDLYSLCQAIDQYTQDKNKAPTSLEDLVRTGYLNEIPVDPITRPRLIQQGIDDRVHPPTPGISNVHSGSNQVGTDGTRLRPKRFLQNNQDSV